MGSTKVILHSTHLQVVKLEPDCRNDCTGMMNVEWQRLRVLDSVGRGVRCACMIRRRLKDPVEVGSVLGVACLSRR